MLNQIYCDDLAHLGVTMFCAEPREYRLKRKAKHDTNSMIDDCIQLNCNSQVDACFSLDDT